MRCVDFSDNPDTPGLCVVCGRVRSAHAVDTRKTASQVWPANLTAGASDDAGDAKVLRAFIEHHRCTPDMMASDRDHWKRRAEVAESIAGHVALGWRLVPIEPSFEMIHAAYLNQKDAINVGFAQAYRDMVAAAPQPPPAAPVKRESMLARIFGCGFCAILFLSLIYAGVDSVGATVEHFTHDPEPE